MIIRFLLLALLMACASVQAALAADHEVKMLNNGADGLMVFEPGYLKIEKGDTVKFLATDRGHNTVSHAVPDGGPTWKGAFDEEVSVTFDTEGVYIYRCEPHTMLAMVGVIQVGQAANKEAATQAAGELAGKIMTNKDRLDRYMAQVK